MSGRPVAETVKKSPICRPDSDCYDVELSFFNPNNMNYAVIYSFCNTGTCAYAPIGNLIIDTNGNLYGATSRGGANGEGGVYELVKPTSGAWTYVDLYDFCSTGSCADGSQPIDGLTYAGALSGTAYDGTSLLYGATSSGGSSNKGVVFALHLGAGGAWSERVLHSFSGASSDGDDPVARPIVDSSNNLWGVTIDGGTGDNQGTAYELTPIANLWSGPWTEKIVFNFCWSGISGTTCPAGVWPQGLTMDGSGNLIGTTLLGGASTSSGQGMLFKLTVGSSCTEGGTATFLCMTDLYDFCGATNCVDGKGPSAGPTVDASGNIFGTTEAGGTGNDSLSQGGVAFKFNGSETVLYDFCSDTDCSDGRTPRAPVISDSSGNIYGVTLWGGIDNSGGVLFSLSP